MADTDWLSVLQSLFTGLDSAGQAVRSSAPPATAPRSVSAEAVDYTDVLANLLEPARGGAARPSRQPVSGRMLGERAGASEPARETPSAEPPSPSLPLARTSTTDDESEELLRRLSVEPQMRQTRLQALLDYLYARMVSADQGPNTHKAEEASRG